jgi:hypothetical protein
VVGRSLLALVHRVARLLRLFASVLNVLGVLVVVFAFVGAMIPDPNGELGDAVISIEEGG